METIINITFCFIIGWISGYILGHTSDKFITKIQKPNMENIDTLINKALNSNQLK